MLWKHFCKRIDDLLGKRMICTSPWLNFFFLFFLCVCVFILLLIFVLICYYVAAALVH